MTISPLIRSAVMGCPNSDPSYDPSAGTNRWHAEFYRGMWRRPSMTEPIGVATGFISPTTYLILKGALLP